MKQDLISKERKEYLKLLSRNYKNSNEVSTELINLQAILSLPKGTEHFISDIHGEATSFIHVLKNASGVIRQKILETFSNSMTKSEMRTIATLIYYPKKKLELLKADKKIDDSWYKVTLIKLIKLTRVVASKYTRSKVRKALPKEFSYIMEELLHEHHFDQEGYYNRILMTIIETGKAEIFIIALSELIQRLSIDHLHIIGDIFDRGPGADVIMDRLMKYHSLDIQWGNHDILWMGAASGSDACIANVIRISLRYVNLNTLEHGYGVSLRPLLSFAMKIYKDDSCEFFLPKTCAEKELSQAEKNEIAKMHKAISIIQFKLEGQIIKSHPKFEMDDRLLLDKISKDKKNILINGKTYPLLDNNFPTINEENPYKLSEQEQLIVNYFHNIFVENEKLQKHTKLLFSKGSMYSIYNSNLLFHGCILLNKDGSFHELSINNELYSGKKLMDKFDQIVRQGYFSVNQKLKNYGKNIMWYLWTGSNSPLFGKNKMATFERYFIKNKELEIEEKNPYFKYREQKNICDNIFNEFGMNPENSHIINGHVPVKSKLGESPVKSQGKLIVIDGGFAKAYQSVTGIAGYTLIYNSYGLVLVAHEPFESKIKSLNSDKDMVSKKVFVKKTNKRKLVQDTDPGKKIQEKINNLTDLLLAFRRGVIAGK